MNVQKDFPWLPDNSQQAKDIERFRWFSDDYLAVSVNDKKLISDVRYSFIPNNINSMWGIEINKRLIDDGDYDAHVFYETNNNLDKETRDLFLDMLL